MIAKKQLDMKSLFILALSFTLSFILFTTCLNVDEDFIKPQLIFLHEGEIVFQKVGGSKTFELNSNKDWTVTKGADADWIDFNPKNGLKGTSIFTISIKSNHGMDREAFLTVTASSLKRTITVRQKGEGITDVKYTTIKEIRSKYLDNGEEKWIISEQLKLKGIAISDKDGGNRPSQRDGFIQDEAGDGLAFRVTQSIHSFDLGDQMSINLEGATLLYYGGILQINFSDKSAEVQFQNVAVAPQELTIEAILNGSYDATLVKIKDVQFKDYKVQNYYDKGLATNRTLETCDGATLIVKTTKYASFKDQPLPQAKGDIVGIVSQNDGKWELLIRNLNDVKEMSNDESTRCPKEVPPVVQTKISIANLRVAIKHGEAYAEENYIEGEIILNSYKGNVPDNIVYLSDESGGIALSFSDKANILTNLPMGAKVKVNVKGAKAKVLNGLLFIGDDNSLSTQEAEIKEKTPSTPLQLKVATLEDIHAGKYQSELVVINDVQFKDIAALYSDNPFVMNKAKKQVQVSTRKEAAFANETVKQGMGSVVAIVGVHNSPHLIIRSIDDLADMTGSRFVDPFIAIDEEAITFQQKGGNQTITITANVNWVASSNVSWITISPSNGSINSVITVTASKNQSKERIATITISDGTITKSVQVSQRANEVSADAAKDLFFSEYVEGSSNNKYLEIYNGTGATIDLSDYKIELYVNGQTIAKTIEILTGSLENGKVIVFRHSKAAIYDGEATVSTAINYNGNDAIALVKISTDAFVDIIGRIGHDPGKGWKDLIDKDLITLDKTLVRKPSVRVGVKVNPIEGFPTLGTEWISYPVDTADYLGWHTMN